MRVAEPEIETVRQTMTEIGKLDLPGKRSFDAGLNASPEQRDQGFNLGFVVTFEDWDALATYQAHPDHQRQGKALLSALANPDHDLLVMDWEF